MNCYSKDVVWSSQKGDRPENEWDALEKYSLKGYFPDPIATLVKLEESSNQKLEPKREGNSER